MKKSYIQMQSYGGFDWHDIHSENHQMLVDGRPEIKDIKTAIIDDVCTRFHFADREKVEYAFDHPFSGGYQAPVSVFVTDLNGKTHEELLNTTVFIGYEEGCFCTIIEHQYSERVFYEVSNIDEENSLFIPIHMYVHGLKYGNTIERFYHKPFASYEEACQYRDNWNELKIQKEHLLAYQDDATEVLVFDAEDVKNSCIKDWYEYNLRIVDMMESLGETVESENFSIAPETHLQQLESSQPQVISM